MSLMDAEEPLSEGWHYAALGDLADTPVSPFTSTPALTGRERVVGIGALCDFTQEPTGNNPELGIIIFEHCVLDDGQKVHLDDRGFSQSPVRWTDGVTVETLESAPAPPLESLTRDVLNCVLPEDLPDGSPPVEDHPWEDLARRAQRAGVSVTAGELRGLEYYVEFTERVREWVGA